jgi:hemerythrin-like domain-containing protein
MEIPGKWRPCPGAGVQSKDKRQVEERQMAWGKRANRRTALASGLAVIAGFPALAVAENQGTIAPDKGVTAPEDLMKEHGVLHRCLLIYEEGLRRLRDKKDVSPQVFQQTAQLVRVFVEEYHEKNEEKYIFPEFERAKKLTELVETLKVQHRVGRKMTAEILRLSQPEAFRSAENRDKLAAACQAFIRMYRPHAAREDTVLFPALRTILPPERVAALGDQMEEDEHRVLGDEGFERSVDKVATLEKQLGIYDLKQFTPSA